MSDSRDLEHSHLRWAQDWDNGNMDGFAQSGASPATLPYSYVPEKDVEEYWTLARQYVLGDRMFQSNTGPSFVAHQYMIAGQSANVAENPTGSVWGCDASPDTTAAVLGADGTEMPGVFPCFDYLTAADLLDEKGVTWRYYAPSSGDSFFILSAFQAIRHIRYGQDWHDNVISPQNRFLTDIANGELAQVTWIVPDWAHSDHPGSGSEGPSWVASIINAIGNSPYWNSTAIFISWDDWGGWYDHVAPPKVDAMGPGFRVPLLIVSPYAKHGYITHQIPRGQRLHRLYRAQLRSGHAGHARRRHGRLQRLLRLYPAAFGLRANSHARKRGPPGSREEQRPAGRRLKNRE